MSDTQITEFQSLAEYIYWEVEHGQMRKATSLLSRLVDERLSAVTKERDAWRAWVRELVEALNRRPSLRIGWSPEDVALARFRELEKGSNP